MNWRVITGLILLIVGIRVFYIASHGEGKNATYIALAGAVWVGVGIFFIIRAMTSKKQ